MHFFAKLLLILLTLLFLQACAEGAKDSLAPSVKPLRSAIYPAGTFSNKDISMRLSCVPNDCEVHYTIDNDNLNEAIRFDSNPIKISSIKYTNKPAVIRYFAIDSKGIKENPVHTQEYIIDQQKPTGVKITDSNGVEITTTQFDAVQDVTITCTPDLIDGFDLGCVNLRYVFVPDGGTPPDQTSIYDSIPINSFISISENGTLYYYGEDAAGNASSDSPYEYVFSFNNIVKNVANLTASFSNAQINLSWDAVDSAVGYVVRRSDSQVITSRSQGIEVYNGTASNFSDTAVVAGTNYHYLVFAYDNAMPNANYSTGVDYSVAAVADVEPGDIVDLNIFPGDTQISFSWTNPGDLDLKEIQIKRSSGQNPTPMVFSVNKQTTSFVDTDLINDTVYEYTFTAIDTGGLMSPGIIELATPKAPPVVDKPPQNVTDFSVTPLDQRLQLTWINPVDADFAGVRIIQSIVGAPADHIVSASEAAAGDSIAYEGLGDVVDGSAQRTTTILSLDNNTTYYYRIFATDSGGQFSAAATAPSVSAMPVADSLVPVVTVTSPLSVNGVDPTIGSLVISFNKDIAPGSLIGGITLVENISNKTISGTAVLDPNNSKNVIYTINDSALALAASYTATVLPTMTDLNSNFVTGHSWQFTTADGEWGVAAQSLENLSATASTDRVKRIAFDGSGNALAVWQQQSPSGLSAVYSNEYDTVLGWDAAQAKTLNSQTISAYRPALAVMDNGDAVATWLQGSSSNVWAAKYQKVSGWQTPVRIQDLTLSDASVSPQIVIDSTGVVTIAWRQYQAGQTTQYDVWARRVPFGLDWTNLPPETAAVRIETKDLLSGVEVNVSTDSVGNTLVAWIERDLSPISAGTLPPPGNVMYNYFDVSLGVAGEWSPVELGPINSVPGRFSNLNMKMAANGTAVAAWLEEDTNMYVSNFVVVDANNLTTGWQPTQLLSNAGIVSSYSRYGGIGLGIHADGSAIAIWAQRTTASQSYITEFDPVTGSWSAAMFFSDSFGAQYDVAVDKNKNALLTWGIYNDAGIAGVRYTSGMSVSQLISAPQILLNKGGTVNGQYGAVSVAADNKGNGLAIYTSTQDSPVTTASLYDVYVTRFSLPDPRPNLTIQIDKSTPSVDAFGNVELKLDYTVVNTGTSSSGPFEIGLWANLATAPVFGQTADITIIENGLAGGASVPGSTLILTMSTAITGSPYAIADSTNVIVEPTELDNITKGADWTYNPQALNIEFTSTTQKPPEVNNVPGGVNWVPTSGTVGSNKPPAIKTGAVFKSGDPNLLSRSCFSLNAIQSSAVSFDYINYSTLANRLEFYVNNQSVQTFAGSTTLLWKNGWSTDSLATPLVSGVNTYKWCYYKASSQTVGTSINGAWIDKIIIWK